MRGIELSVPFREAFVQFVNIIFVVGLKVGLEAAAKCISNSAFAGTAINNWGKLGRTTVVVDRFPRIPEIISVVAFHGRVNVIPCI